MKERESQQNLKSEVMTQKKKKSICLYSVSCQQRSGLEDPTEVVCFKC